MTIGRSTNEDRLSALPVGIQRYIISLMPTKDAARMASVSKLWRTTWYSTPKFHFDYFDFPESENTLENFRRVVDQTLAGHDDSDVETFKIYLCIHGDDVDDDDLEYAQKSAIDNNWINFAVSHNVKKLSVYGSFYSHSNFPADVFTCKSLVHLDLALETLAFELPPNAFLPNLKRIDLKMVNLSEESFTNDISLMCPLLEEMQLAYCNLIGLKVLAITASKLQVFIMKECDYVEDCEVHLDAPELETFLIASGVAKNYVLNTPKLVKASTNCGSYDLLGINRRELSESLLKVIGMVSKVKHLWFNHTTIEVLWHARDLWNSSYHHISFCNVENAELYLSPTSHHVEMAALILCKCPNLKDLVIDMQPMESHAMEMPGFESDLENMHVPLIELAKVKIRKFQATENEMVLVKFLLNNSPKLLHRKITKTSSSRATTEITLASDDREEYVNACSGVSVLLSLSD